MAKEFCYSQVIHRVIGTIIVLATAR
jgi:hypothetical protein